MRKPKSEIAEAVHETAAGLYKVGLIDSLIREASPTGKDAGIRSLMLAADRTFGAGKYQTDSRDC